MKPISKLASALIGFLISANFFIVIAKEAFTFDTSILIATLAPTLIALLTVYGNWSRRLFVLIGIFITLADLLINPDWQNTLLSGLNTAAFIASFFAALTTLKFSAASSPAMRKCGAFLSAQPPGRRYLALTFGGQLFGLLLNYGAIQLLGSISTSRVSPELSKEVRDHRIRRMLLAIQRGFISILPWSPFSFAILISTTLIPGASWKEAALPGLISGLILVFTGWALDQIFKPKITSPRTVRPQNTGKWSILLPLFFLLLLLSTLLVGLHLLTGIRILVLVMLTVPVISLLWVAVQTRHKNTRKHVVRRTKTYLFSELSKLRNEMLLLMMAGYIGVTSSPLLQSTLNHLGIDLTSLPTWLLLVGIVWLIPLAGQLGMNPILIAALIAPALPDATALGVTPTSIVIAMTAGWILSGVSSPFTATTLLTGSFANVSAFHVGVRWNGFYTILCGSILSAWVVLFNWL